MIEATVGFIGLGQMGLGMAKGLMKSGVKLYVHNRTKEKAEPLLSQGAEWIETPRDFFEKTPIVFSMLADDEALKGVTLGPNGLLENASDGSIHVSMSTVSIPIVKELAEVHKGKGAVLLSAPVFGRPDAAAAQKLWICIAGESSAKERAVPLLQYMGQKVVDFGNVPEKANAAKLAGNFLILSAIEAMAESCALLQKMDVDIAAFHTFLTDTFFASAVYQGYGKLITSKEFSPPGFKLALGLKDIHLVAQAAEMARVPMPLVSQLHDRLIAALAKNRGDQDWAAISLSSFEDASL